MTFFHRRQIGKARRNPKGQILVFVERGGMVIAIFRLSRYA
jgi:hypothetical protein